MPLQATQSVPVIILVQSSAFFIIAKETADSNVEICCRPINKNILIIPASTLNYYATLLL